MYAAEGTSVIELTIELIFWYQTDEKKNCLEDKELSRQTKEAG